MPPLDDELRAALATRAAMLAPSPDPMAGVERRARSIRRRRTAASVAGTALAVLAVVGVGAALTPGSALLPEPGPVATPGPTQEPAPPAPGPTSTPPPDGRTPAPARDASILDPARPWQLRGQTGLLPDAELPALRDSWAARHPGTSAAPLYVQSYEPAGTTEVVVVADGDRPRWGVLRSSESGFEVVVDEPLPPAPRALAAALEGDESPRLLVVAAPSAGQAQYAPDGRTWRAMADTATGAPGVFVHALDGDPARDQYRVLDGDGDLDAPLHRAPAPDAPRPAGPAAAPANVVEWEPRGTIDGELVVAVRTAWGRSREDGTTGEQVQEKVLFAGRVDGHRVLLAQLWVPGDDRAATVGYVRPASGQAELVPVPALDDAAPVVVLPLSPSARATTSPLVVGPRPGTGQVLYAERSSEYRPVEADSGFDGVVVVDRPVEAGRVGGDRLRLLDGDSRPSFDGEVASLVCGARGCR